jgi:hypothetical protein
MKESDIIVIALLGGIAGLLFAISHKLAVITRFLEKISM